MRLFETHYSDKGEPLAFSVIDVDNEFMTFEVFRRGRWSPDAAGLSEGENA